MTSVIGYFTDTTNIPAQKVGDSPIILYDDFGDNVYATRNKTIGNMILPYMNFRPEWNVISGTWSAATGALVKSAQGADFIQMTDAIGVPDTFYAECSAYFANYTSDNENGIFILDTSSMQNGYDFNRITTHQYFDVTLGGVTTTLIDNTVGKIGNTTVVLKFQRRMTPDLNTWEIWEEGVSGGTVINNDVAVSLLKRITFRIYRATGSMDNLKVYQ